MDVTRETRGLGAASGLTARCALWLHAARPKTLWAAFAPVLIGTAMAVADGRAHAPAALAALLAATLIQIGTNFANDLGDYCRGADAQDRQGPLRLTQAGLVTPRTMLAATVFVFAAAFLCSLYLVWRGGWPLLVIGLLAILSGALYTAGPWPLAYVGLGDVFVLIFFGPVAVAGTYYAQALVWSPATWGAGLAPGLLAVAILVVNNLRDHDGDARARKRTLVVRFGRRFARLEYTACVAGAALVPPLLLAMGGGSAPRGVLLALLGLLALIAPLRAVWTREDAPSLNPQLGATARGLLIYSVLFAVGWIL